MVGLWWMHKAREWQGWRGHTLVAAMMAAMMVMVAGGAVGRRASLPAAAEAAIAKLTIVLLS